MPLAAMPTISSCGRDAAEHQADQQRLGFMGTVGRSAHAGQQTTQHAAGHRAPRNRRRHGRPTCHAVQGQVQHQLDQGQDAESDALREHQIDGKAAAEPERGEKSRDQGIEDERGDQRAHRRIIPRSCQP